MNKLLARGRLLSWALAVAASALIAIAVALPAAQTETPACREIVLHDGKISTMDGHGTQASSIVIRDDRVVAVGTARGIPAHRACATVIDLRGHRVIPGMIDAHDHPTYFTARPGHDVRLDTAESIATVQTMIRARAGGLAVGEWITSFGGWTTTAIAEHRVPTLAELDAAAPNHPVFLVPAANPVQGVTNSRGKAFFAAKGIAVGADGILAADPMVSALNTLRAMQTFEDRKRTIRDLLAYYASMGVTTHLDNGGQRPPRPDLADVVRSGDGGLQMIDPAIGYAPELALAQENRLPGRLRIFFYSTDLTPALVFLRQRLDNQLMGFGNDWMRVAGVGERVAGGNAQSGGDGEWTAAGEPTPQYEAAVRLIAERGWGFQQHATALADAKRHTDLWEKVNATTPIGPLRWILAHARGIDRPTLDRLKAMGVGISIAGRYMSDGRQTNAPVRLIVDSGIHAGFGSDSPTITPSNPWLHMYALVTGRNYAGMMIEPDQILTRAEALRLFTANGAWFARDEDSLGSLEAGKLADAAVLSGDFLDSTQVPDDAIKRLTSVLTIVGGRIVHDSGALGVPRQQEARRTALQ